MGLRKLTAEYAEGMIGCKNCRIYLVDYSEQYVKELFAKYDLLDHLAGVLQDTDNRMAGDRTEVGRKALVCGRELPVYSYEDAFDLEYPGSFIILNDYFEQTYERLMCRKKEESKATLDIFYFENHETEIEIYYRRKYEHTPLEDLIIFRSGPHASSYVKGMDYTDNARALFEYMLKEGYNQRYRLVWLVKEPQGFSRIAQKHENISFVSFDWSVSEKKEERDAYYEVLCLAKYIFMTDAYGFARNARKDQIRVQLWHGCGFKTRVNFVRCEKRYEYTTVISDLYAKIHQEIYGLRADQVLVTGYAKEDWLFHPDREAWEALSMPKAKKYIFWLPTFRMAKEGLGILNEYEQKGQTGLPAVDTKEKLEELDRLLAELNVVLVIKLHPFQDPGRIGRFETRHVVLLDNDLLMEKDIQINRLLGWADGLISDYSSAAVDYLLLDRSIGFILEDVEEYGESRGFVFDPIRDWLPGAELFSFADFCSFVREIGMGIDSTREKRQKL